MKRCLYFLFLFVLPIFSQAQSSSTIYFSDDSEQKFFGGIVAGMNVSQVDGDTYSGYHKVGLNAGGIVYWRFMQQVGLSIELLYSQKGARAVQDLYNPYAGPGFGKYKINLNYAEVPLVFHYFLSSKYQIGAGVSYNGLISAHEEITPDYNYSHIDPDNILFNKSTFDAIVSGSMMLWKGVMVNIRYQYSITPVRNWNNLAGVGSGDQFNNMFTFRIAYLF